VGFTMNCPVTTNQVYPYVMFEEVAMQSRWNPRSVHAGTAWRQCMSPAEVGLDMGGVPRVSPSRTWCRTNLPSSRHRQEDSERSPIDMKRNPENDLLPLTAGAGELARVAPLIPSQPIVQKALSGLVPVDPLIRDRGLGAFSRHTRMDRGFPILGTSGFASPGRSGSAGAAPTGSVRPL
jgi:hypothetical protein